MTVHSENIVFSGDRKERVVGEDLEPVVFQSFRDHRAYHSDADEPDLVAEVSGEVSAGRAV